MSSNSASSPDLSTSLRSIWRLTWPQMLMMFLISCISFIDVWTAGGLGGGVQAVLGIVTQSVFFLMVVILALSSGALAAISQSLGAGRSRRARRYVGMVVLCAALLGAAMAAAGTALCEPLFTLLRVPEDILPVARSYWCIAMFTLPAHYIFSSTGILFRATRQVFPPLVVVAVLCVCNLVGNLGFGLGYWGLPACGYVGIAWTTFGVMLLGASFHVALLIRYGWLRRADLPSPRWMRRGAPYLLAVALPAGAAQVVWQGGYMALYAIVGSLPVDGVNALAGFTAGHRVESLLFLPGMAFSMTSSVVVGNSLGADNRLEARRLAFLLAGCGCAFMSCLAALLWPGIAWIAAQLSGDAGVQTQIVHYLQYNLLAAPFTALSMIFGGAMTGAGATRYNLMIYGSCFWLLRLPLAWAFGHYIWGDASGVFMAMLASQVVQSSIMCYALRHCDWMRFSMRHNRHARIKS